MSAARALSCGTCQSCAVPGRSESARPFPSSPTIRTPARRTRARATASARASSRTASRARPARPAPRSPARTASAARRPATARASAATSREAGQCKPIDGAEDPSADAPCEGTSICIAPGGAAPTCKLKDGETCTTSDQCANGSCLTSYADDDHDGWGGNVVRRCELTPQPGLRPQGRRLLRFRRSDAHPGVTAYSQGRERVRKLRLGLRWSRRVSGHVHPSREVRLDRARPATGDASNSEPTTGDNVMNLRRIVYALLILSAACHGGTPSTGKPQPAVKATCHTDADCGPGLVCASDLCATPLPTAAQYQACSLDVDCPAGDHCDLGACTHSCVADRDCAAGLTCDVRGRCAMPATANQQPAPTPPTPTAPVLAVDSSQLDFTTFTETKTITLTNTGDAPLSFRVLADKTWLAAQPVTGTVDVGASESRRHNGSEEWGRHARDDHNRQLRGHGLGRGGRPRIAHGPLPRSRSTSPRRRILERASSRSVSLSRTPAPFKVSSMTRARPPSASVRRSTLRARCPGRR